MPASVGRDLFTASGDITTIGEINAHANVAGRNMTEDELEILQTEQVMVSSVEGILYRHNICIPAQ